MAESLPTCRLVTTKTRNWLIVLFILALPFALFLGSLIFMAAGPFAPVPPLPNPNGYDGLVKAGQMIAGDPSDNHLNQQQLERLIATNAEALQLFRDALSNSCRVPLQYSPSYISNHLNDLAGIKRLAQALAAEGRLAELDGHTNAAARSYVDVIRLGNACSRGGVLIDQLVGLAVERIGTTHLESLMNQLDASTCRQTAASLGALDVQSQTWDQVVRQERDWSRRTFPGIGNELQLLMTRKALNQAEHRAEERFKAQVLRRRQLMIDLARRAYQLDKGQPPASAADLVPDYLKGIPQDPVTGKDLP